MKLEQMLDNFSEVELEEIASEMRELHRKGKSYRDIVLKLVIAKHGKQLTAFEKMVILADKIEYNGIISKLYDDKTKKIYPVEKKTYDEITKPLEDVLTGSISRRKFVGLIFGLIWSDIYTPVEIILLIDNIISSAIMTKTN